MEYTDSTAQKGIEELKFVIVGHVDHGKSTLIGRLLYDTNSLSADKIGEIEKLSHDKNQETEFAYFLDALEEERQQGITIDTTQVFFSTPTRRYVIIDAPGHIEFIRNMITGASQAHAAVLIIDAHEGIQDQTKRHAYVLSLMGIEHILVVINKLDSVTNPHETYKKVKASCQEIISALNIHIETFIPISALRGDNVVERSAEYQWYDGATVLEALEAVQMKHEQGAGSFIMPVQDVYKIDTKRIVVGKIESGSVAVGDAVAILPGLQTSIIKSIEVFGKKSDSAEAGESIGLTLNDALFTERGNVMCHKGYGVSLCNEVHATVLWMGKVPHDINNKLMIRIATQETICTIKEVIKRIDSSSLKLVEDTTGCIQPLEVAEVIIKVKKEMVTEKFAHIPALGRFILLHNDQVCAGGVII